MNRLWSSFIILAVIVIFIFVGYEVYLSSTGANATFSKTVSSIEPSLGTAKLAHFTSLVGNMPIADKALDNK